MITEMSSVRRQLVRHRGKTNCTCDRIEAPSALTACHGECRPVLESVGSTCIQLPPNRHANSKHWFTGHTSLEEGAGKRCSECDRHADVSTDFSSSQFTVEVRTFVVYLFA